ncbi:MAG: hypothetical protein Tsb005_19330 [Gammaproteobacteria bacterium]
MKRHIIVLSLIAAAGFLVGFAVQYALNHFTSHANTASTERKPLYWVAPMDANYRRDKPGKSPMGMDLVPVYADDRAAATDDPNAVRISAAVQNNLGVRTAPVVRSDLARQINTVGYVTPDENLIEHVHTYTDGWVRKLYVKTTGEHVQKGQLLLELYSPTLVNAQEEFLLALANNDQRLQKATRKKLLTLGMSAQQIDQIQQARQTENLVKIFANTDGIVSQLFVREGAYVKPDKDLLVLEDLAHIWVIAEVFERQAPWVKAGQSAQASMPYLADKIWRGVVDYVYPRLDPQTHTVKVRLRFDNQDELLKPNMYADVIIFAAVESQALNIPAEALIRSGNGDRVVVQLANGQFKSKPVKIGIESGDRVQILAGLKEGERVVTSAQFLLDSETNLNAGLERLESSSTTPKTSKQP